MIGTICARIPFMFFGCLASAESRCTGLVKRSLQIFWNDFSTASRRAGRVAPSSRSSCCGRERGWIRGCLDWRFIGGVWYTTVMIDLTLSDEQKQLQEMARKFAKEEIIPKAAHHDETGEFPLEICRKAWELGLMNTHVPAEYGGIGLGVLEEAIIGEELA